MTPRRKPPTSKWKIDWGAFSFVLAMTLAILAGVKGFSTFNTDIAKEIGRLEREIAVLNQQVADLREAEGDRRRQREGQ